MKKLIMIILLTATMFSCDNALMDSYNDRWSDENAPYIGMPFQGGIIAYIYQDDDPGYVSGEVHGIIAATEDQSNGIVWISGGSTQSTSVPGGTGYALGTGSGNTDRMIAQAEAAGNTTPTSYAAGLAREYRGGGYNDWCLPSQSELFELHRNKAKIGNFVDEVYWSSTELNSSMVYYQHYIDSNYYDVKSAPYRVRSIRYF